MMNTIKSTLTIVMALLAFGMFSCDSGPAALPEYVLSESIPEIDYQREVRLVSCFFGLDNALPPRSIRLSPVAPGKDGMPAVFSQELDPETMDPSDFAVVSAQGDTFAVEAATFRPAQEAFELRTVLLIGNYGQYPDNEPTELLIVGDLKSRTGKQYQGQKVEATPLMKGPFISYAEYFHLDDKNPYIAKGNGCDCPRESTEVVVRAVWAGGVRDLDGEELGEEELNNFTVTLVNEGDTINVHPFLLADLGDNDNNIDLCLKEKGTPILVSAEANTAIDPNDDANEYTEQPVVSRW